MISSEKGKVTKTSPIVMFGSVILILLGLYGIFYIYTIYHQKASTEPAYMTLTFADLPPIVYKKGYEDPEPLKVGSTITQKDRVLSVKRPRTVFTMLDKSSLRMGPNSEILIDELFKTKEKNFIVLKVSLQKGKVWLERQPGVTMEIDAGRVLVIPFGQKVEVVKAPFGKVIVTAWEGNVAIKPKTRGIAKAIPLKQGNRVTLIPGQKPIFNKVKADNISPWEGWNYWNSTSKIVSGQVTDVKMSHLLTKEKLTQNPIYTAEEEKDTDEDIGVVMSMFGPFNKIPVKEPIDVMPSATPKKGEQATRTGYVIPKKLSHGGVDVIPEKPEPATQQFVTNNAQLQNIKEEILKMMKSKFNMKLQKPLIIEFAEEEGKLSGYSFENGTHTIFVAPRLTLEKTFGIVSYWCAYAWFLENASNIKDYKYNCGFSGWIAYKLSCNKKYYSFCKELLETPELGRIVKFLIDNIEDKYGEYGVFEYCVLGIDVAGEEEEE